MAYVAVDSGGDEYIYSSKPIRNREYQVWGIVFDSQNIELVKGSIEKLIGRKLTWEDEPVELKEEK